MKPPYIIIYRRLFGIHYRRLGGFWWVMSRYHSFVPPFYPPPKNEKMLDILFETVKHKAIEIFMEWAKPHVIAYHIRECARQNQGLPEVLRECLVNDFNQADREQTLQLMRGYAPVWRALAENPEWSRRELFRLIKYLSKFK